MECPAVFEALLKYVTTYNEKVELVYANTKTQQCSRFSREDQLLITKLRTGNSDAELSTQFKVEVIIYQYGFTL